MLGVLLDCQNLYCTILHNNTPPNTPPNRCLDELLLNNQRLFPHRCLISRMQADRMIEPTLSSFLTRDSLRIGHKTLL